MKTSFIVLLASLVFLPFFALGAEFPAQARLGVAFQSADPEDLNQEMKAQTLGEFDQLLRGSVEITYPLFSRLYVGVNYSKRISTEEENPANATTEYQGEITQDAYMFVLRVPILKSEFFMFDVFAAGGGTNTSFKIKNASQDGKLEKTSSEGLFANPISAYGTSVSFGNKGFYLTVEGGFESNKIKSLKRQGNINGNVTEIDLSGGYVFLGLTFDGIKAFTK